MIFLTVGTHEQQFDRLIKEIDNLKKNNIIEENIFIQTGYSKYIPQYCTYKKLISYKEMEYYTHKSRVVITHGGPGSIFLPIQYGKVPIVVPRNPKFNEHIDDHQIKFAKRMENDNKILAIYSIKDLQDYIVNYDKYISDMKIGDNNNLDTFTYRLDKICKELLGLPTQSS